MKYSKVHSPKWVSDDQTMIDCVVKFDHLKIEVPFTAAPDHIEPHSRQIFQRCLNGDFGPVSPYEPAQSSPAYPADNDIYDELSEWPELVAFLEQANVENTSGTVRGIILVWSSMIEKMLGHLLEAFLADHSISRRLIHEDANGPLSAFSGRVKLCFALGLISKRDLTICDQIKKIRNFAAHQWNISLQSSEFNKRVVPALMSLYQTDHAKLHVWELSDLRRMLRAYYTPSCGMLARRLAKRILEVKEERRTILTDSGVTDT